MSEIESTEPQPVSSQPAQIAGTTPLPAEVSKPATGTSGIAGSTPSGDPVRVDGVETDQLPEPAGQVKPVGTVKQPEHFGESERPEPVKQPELGDAGEFAEPPARAEAPRYEGPMPGQVVVPNSDEGDQDPLAGLRGVGDPVGIVERSPEFHAALITGEAQAGHRYPHDRP